MIFNDAIISRLRSEIKSRMSEKRYIHTLGVEKLARYLGSVLLPDRLDELSAAALLHDVVKEMSFDEHVALLRDSDFAYTEEDIGTKPALHSIAAVPFIKEKFAEFATDDILSAVANHTLGSPDMSVFDEIIFISDYAEEGRTYRTCIEVREHLLNNVRVENEREDNLIALHKASLRSLLSTIESLSCRKEKINSRTIMTKRYFDTIIGK